MQAFLSLPDILARHAALKPDACAVLLDAGPTANCQRLTYSSLHAQSATLAKALGERLRPGDRALLVFPTSLEFVISYFACLMAGIVAVPMMPPRRNSNHDASAAIISDCQPRLALTLLEDAHPGAVLNSRLTQVGVEQLGVAMSSEAAATSAFSNARDDLAFLQYTSGSTSEPKGVMVSHGNLVDNLEMIRSRLGNHDRSTHVGWIPHYHDMGLIMNLLQPIFLGAQSVIMRPAGFMLRPLNWLRAIHSHRAEVAAAPNFAYDLCVARFHPDQMEGVDLSSWKIAVNGAEPVRATTLERFAKTFAPYGFSANAMHPSYGLAEATLMVSSADRRSAVKTRTVSMSGLQLGLIRETERPEDSSTIVSCGRPVDGVHVAIVNPDSHRAAGPDEIGEIWLKGSSVAKGYWGTPDKKESVFNAATSSPSSIIRSEDSHWLRTGDLGYKDSNGRNLHSWPHQGRYNYPRRKSLPPRY